MKRIRIALGRLSEGSKSSLALFVASVVTSGISYVVTPIYTRLLPSELFGQTSLFMTWMNVLGIVAMFSLSSGVFNNGMSDYPEQRKEYSFSLLILSNIITVVFSIVLIAIYPFVQQFIGLERKYIYLMIGYFLVQPAFSFWMVSQRYEFKYKYVVIWTIACAVLSPLVAVIVVLNSQESSLLDARIFGALIPLIAVYFGFYFYTAKQSGFRLTKKYWRSAFLFNLPLIPHYLSMYLLGSSDKLMISYLISDSATAYYSVAYSVAAVATIVWSAINSSLIPYTYEKCKQGDFAAIKRATTPIVIVFALACLLVIMLAPEVVAVMATSEYREAIYVIPPIVGGVFFQVQYFLFANIVFFYKQPTYVMIGSVISTVLNIILNYVFIGRYGYIAAGYTTLLCYIVQAVIDYFAMRKVTKADLYNMRFITGLSAVVIVIALLSNLIYDLTLVRYAIVLSTLIFAYLIRDWLMNATRKPKIT